MNTLQKATVRTVPENTFQSLEGSDSSSYSPQGPSNPPNNDGGPPTSNNPRVPSDDNMDSINTDVSCYRQNYTNDDTYLEGEILLETFVEDQIYKSGVVTSGCETPRTRCRRAMGSNIRSAGLELRRMADAFELTYERQQVKDKANEIGLGVRTYAEFRELLSALFNPGGITQGRIIVLFFFCADVAIRSLKAGINLFNRFMRWSYQYFAERVCDWVRRNGGWVAVLSPDTFYPRVAVAAAAIVVVCAVVYKFVKK